MLKTTYANVFVVMETVSKVEGELSVSMIVFSQKQKSVTLLLVPQELLGRRSRWILGFPKNVT